MKEKKEESKEGMQAELAITKVRQFMMAIKFIIQIQTWYRMMTFRRTFNRFRAKRREVKKLYYSGWFKFWRSEKGYRWQTRDSYFMAWKGEWQDTKRLQMLVSTFFAMCIKRLKLTPQALMAFFQAKKWSKFMKPEDLTKIRRLILIKMFKGWSLEVRRLKKNRFSAHQIISRCYRRSNGTLYAKESMLICFHMWRRYIAVNIAYRLEKSEPRFDNPFMVQWTKYLHKLYMFRIHKQRVKQRGILLQTRRIWAIWRKILSLGLAAYLSPDEQAKQHFKKVICTKVLNSLLELLRARGKSVRCRNRCFNKWKRWAPLRNHKTELKKKMKILTTNYNCKRTFDRMTSLCLTSIGRRTKTLRLLRDNISNWKVLMCASALLGRDSHMMMYDCWRKWSYWSQARARWKATLWQYRYMWITNKTLAIFSAWKSFTLAGKERKRILNLSDNSNDDHSINKSVDKIIDNENNDRICLQNLMNVSLSDGINGFNNLSRPIRNLVNIDKSVEIPWYNLEKPQTPQIKPSTEGLLEDFSPLFKNIQTQSINLFEKAQYVGVPIFPHLPAFFLGCLLFPRAHRIVLSKRNEVINEGNLKHADEHETDDFKEAIRLREVQDKLQYNLDYLNINETVDNIENGALIESNHIRQIGTHLGEGYLPLFSLLIGASVIFLCERVNKHDSNKEILTYADPLKAVLAMKQIDRWERGCLSRRELSFVEQNSTETSNLVGSSSQSIILWRSVTLLLLKKKADMLHGDCKQLDERRSVDGEVKEVLKRNKIKRYRQIRMSLSSIFGNENDSTSHLIDHVPQVVKYDDEIRAEREQKSLELNSFLTSETLDIYAVLEEFTLMLGRLSSEAKAFREPLLVRDDALIRRGFLKTARTDFLKMREYCMTPNQKKEIEKNRKLEASKKAKALKKKKKLAKAKEKNEAKQAAAAAEEISKLQSNNNSLDKGDMDENSVVSDVSIEENKFDLYKMASLTEENDLLGVLDYDLRTQERCDEIVYVETWRPVAKRKIENVRDSLKKIIYDSSFDVKSRLLSIFDDMEIPDNDIIEVSGGLGSWLIFDYLKADDKTIYSYNWKSILPNEWFELLKILSRIETESTVINTLIKLLDNRVAVNSKNQVFIDQENKKLSEFFVYTNASVAVVAKKRFTKLEEENGQRKSKMRILESLHKNVDKTNKLLNELNSKLGNCEFLLSNNNFEAIYALFGIPTAAHLDELSADKSRYRTYEVIEEQRANISVYHEQIVDWETRIEKGKLDLKAYDKYCSKSNIWLKNMAESRFNSMLQVQDIIKRSTGTKLQFQKSNEDEMKYLNTFVAYNQNLQDYDYKLKIEFKRLKIEDDDRIRKANERLRLGSKAHLYDKMQNVSDKKSKQLLEKQERARDKKERKDNLKAGGIISVEGNNNVRNSQASILFEDGDNMDRLGDINDITSELFLSAPELQARPHSVEGNNIISTKNKKIKNKAQQDAHDEEMKRLEDAAAAQIAHSNLRSRTFEMYWMQVETKDPKQKKKEQRAREKEEKEAREKEEKEKEESLKTSTTLEVEIPDLSKPSIIELPAESPISDVDAIELSPSPPRNKTQRMWDEVQASRLRHQIRQAQELLQSGSGAGFVDFFDDNSVTTASMLSSNVTHRKPKQASDFTTLGDETWKCKDNTIISSVSIKEERAAEEIAAGKRSKKGIGINPSTKKSKLATLGSRPNSRDSQSGNSRPNSSASNIEESVNDSIVPKKIEIRKDHFILTGKTSYDVFHSSSVRIGTNIDFDDELPDNAFNDDNLEHYNSHSKQGGVQLRVSSPLGIEILDSNILSASPSSPKLKHLDIVMTPINDSIPNSPKANGNFQVPDYDINNNNNNNNNNYDYNIKDNENNYQKSSDQQPLIDNSLLNLTSRSTSPVSTSISPVSTLKVDVKPQTPENDFITRARLRIEEKERNKALGIVEDAKSPVSTVVSPRVSEVSSVVSDDRLLPSKYLEKSLGIKNVNNDVVEDDDDDDDEYSRSTSPVKSRSSSPEKSGTELTSTFEASITGTLITGTTAESTIIRKEIIKDEIKENLIEVNDYKIIGGSNIIVEDDNMSAITALTDMSINTVLAPKEISKSDQSIQIPVKNAAELQNEIIDDRLALTDTLDVHEFDNNSNIDDATSIIMEEQIVDKLNNLNIIKENFLNENEIENNESIINMNPVEVPVEKRLSQGRIEKNIGNEERRKSSDSNVHVIDIIMQKQLYGDDNVSIEDNDMDSIGSSMEEYSYGSGDDDSINSNDGKFGYISKVSIDKNMRRKRRRRNKNGSKTEKFLEMNPLEPKNTTDGRVIYVASPTQFHDDSSTITSMSEQSRPESANSFGSFGSTSTLTTLTSNIRQSIGINPSIKNPIKSNAKNTDKYILSEKTSEDDALIPNIKPLIPHSKSLSELIVKPEKTQWEFRSKTPKVGKKDINSNMDESNNFASLNLTGKSVNEEDIIGNYEYIVEEIEPKLESRNFLDLLSQKSFGTGDYFPSLMSRGSSRDLSIMVKEELFLSEDEKLERVNLFIESLYEDEENAFGFEDDEFSDDNYEDDDNENNEIYLNNNNYDLGSEVDLSEDEDDLNEHDDDDNNDNKKLHKIDNSKVGLDNDFNETKSSTKSVNRNSSRIRTTSAHPVNIELFQETIKELSDQYLQDGYEPAQMPNNYIENGNKIRKIRKDHVNAIRNRPKSNFSNFSNSRNGITGESLNISSQFRQVDDYSSWVEQKIIKDSQPIQKEDLKYVIDQSLDGSRNLSSSIQDANVLGRSYIPINKVNKPKSLENKINIDDSDYFNNNIDDDRSDKVDLLQYEHPDLLDYIFNYSEEDKSNIEESYHAVLGFSPISTSDRIKYDSYINENKLDEHDRLLLRDKDKEIEIIPEHEVEDENNVLNKIQKSSNVYSVDDQEENILSIEYLSARSSLTNSSTEGNNSNKLCLGDISRVVSPIKTSRLGSASISINQYNLNKNNDINSSNIFDNNNDNNTNDLIINSNEDGDLNSDELVNNSPIPRFTFSPIVKQKVIVDNISNNNAVDNNLFDPSSLDTSSISSDYSQDSQYLLDETGEADLEKELRALLNQSNSKDNDINNLNKIIEENNNNKFVTKNDRKKLKPNKIKISKSVDGLYSISPRSGKDLPPLPPSSPVSSEGYISKNKSLNFTKEEILQLIPKGGLKHKKYGGYKTNLKSISSNTLTTLYSDKSTSKKDVNDFIRNVGGGINNMMSGFELSGLKSPIKKINNNNDIIKEKKKVIKLLSLVPTPNEDIINKHSPLTTPIIQSRRSSLDLCESVCNDDSSVYSITSDSSGNHSKSQNSISSEKSSNSRSKKNKKKL
jgi:hypothetical protein